jgi:hypothetical protein
MNINRLIIKITTEEEPFIFDEKFQNGLNIIASEMNTSGKSSIISGIMYCLGMEEIIGGRGSKVLSAAYNNKIRDTDGKIFNVLKADIFLQISNGRNIITILRTVNDLTRNDNLMTVIYGEYEDRLNPYVKKEDFFVHDSNSAKGKFGFFHFLENFMGLELPNVLGYDGKEKKLYIQNIFAAIMIEQKRGWSDILSRAPNFGIKEPKKKTIEYILNMDSIELSKNKTEIKDKIKENKMRWQELYIETNAYLKNSELRLAGVTKELNFVEKDQIEIISDENSLSLKESIDITEAELKNIAVNKYKTTNDNKNLNEELLQVKENISNYEFVISDLINQQNKETREIASLQEGLENLSNDIQNNIDIRKIVNYGSEKGSNIYEGVCPTCGQKVEDTLLNSQNHTEIMTPEENIKHLKSQKILFESIISQKKDIINDINYKVQRYSQKIKKLNALAVAIKEDLYKLNDEYNEHVILKKIKLEQKLDKLKEVQGKLLNIQNDFTNISEDYERLKKKLSKLIKDDYSHEDYKKIESLKNKFVINLKKFGYRSMEPEENISISYQTLLPEIMGYDLKFDSSASDHIRGIWAYTIALQEVSAEYGGTHPNFIMFDEPNQHSIVEKDMRAFLSKVKSLNNNVQTIIGFTIKDADSKSIIENLSTVDKIIKVDKLAFKKDIKELD